MKTYRFALILVFGAIFCCAASAQSRTSVSASEVNGTFSKAFTGKFKGTTSDIKILALGGGRLRIGMDLAYPYMIDTDEVTANTGGLDGEAKIVGDTAVYHSNKFGPCTITIKFRSPGVISVTQKGADADCGFGHNVTADGTYKKVSSAKPKFDE